MKRKYMTESRGVSRSSDAVLPREEPLGEMFNNLEIVNLLQILILISTPINPPLWHNCGKQIYWHKIIGGTRNFREIFFLGKGTFGEVYRCHFSETSEDAAVKIQKRANRTGHEEFSAEVMALYASDHRNVIKLLGRCNTRANIAILYEFMPHGSLDRHIFGTERQGPRPQGLELPTRVLDWDRRIKIALGVAQGLLYTHQVLKVIHRGVKAENVLLDAYFVPKLADFGSATAITLNQNGDEEQREMCPIKGTTGWIAPETEKHRLVSTKNDVFSYGVLMLVLFTGRKPVDVQKSFVLTDWFKRVRTNLGYGPVDFALGNKYSAEGLHKIYETAMMCINPEPHERPAVSTVERMVLQAAAFPVQKVERSHSI